MDERSATVGRRVGPVWVLVLAFLVSVPVGFYGSAFGSFYASIVAIILVLAGLIIFSVKSRRTGLWVLVIGTGIFVGSLMYVALGVFGADGEPSQTGCVHSTGEPCEVDAP